MIEIAQAVDSGKVKITAGNTELLNLRDKLIAKYKFQSNPDHQAKAEPNQASEKTKGKGTDDSRKSNKRKTIKQRHNQAQEK